MKHLPSRQIRHLLAAALFGLGLLAAPAAHAFTVENQDSTGGATSQNFLDLATKPVTDPDDQVKSRFGSSDGKGGLNLGGGTTLQFGSQAPYEQRYDTHKMFDPLGGPGDPR
jgi:hypothetical protein